jgi:hypothetical protein
VLRVALLLLVACGGARVCPTPQRCPWSDLVDGSQCGGEDGSVQYRSSTPAELARERELFGALLQAAPRGRSEVAALAGMAAAQGFKLVVCDTTAVVVEEASARRGRGAYVIALGPATELLIQIPHSFSDLHTLTMGRELFALAQARVLAISTVHRGGHVASFDSDDPRMKGGGADVAHDAQSTFQAMTLAWLAVHGDRTVVQLHGFGDRRVYADVVVTTGADQPASPWLLGFRDRLRALLPSRIVAAFPNDVDDLGATTNSQGKAVRAANGKFLHVEMSASLREALVRHDGDRHKFLAAMLPLLAR